MKRVSLPAVALMTICCLPVAAEAQFATGRSRIETARQANNAQRRQLTLADRQRQWAMAEVRTAVAKVNFLPRTATVAARVQNAVTSYAPATNSALGYGREWTADDCEKAIRRAETKYHLPPYLLHAIALTESGRGGRPNPLAMNIGGRSYFAPSTGDMMSTVAQYGGETSSIDVGCLQVNLKYHAPRFKNWRSLLVPGYNSEYAALYLTELKRRYGTWNAAVGAYHSRTPWKSANYACLVSRRWSQIFGSVRPGCGADIEAMANLMYQTQGNRG